MMTLKAILTGVVLIAVAMTLEPARAGPNCTCRYFGQNYNLGSQICIKTTRGLRLAKCGLELNNTSWKISKQPCTPIAGMAPKQTRRLTAYVLRPFVID